MPGPGKKIVIIVVWELNIPPVSDSRLAIGPALAVKARRAIKAVVEYFILVDKYSDGTRC